MDDGTVLDPANSDLDCTLTFALLHGAEPANSGGSTRTHELDEGEEMDKRPLVAMSTDGGIPKGASRL